MTLARLRSLSAWHLQESLRLEHAADTASSLDRVTALAHRERAAWHRDTAAELEVLAATFAATFTDYAELAPAAV